MKILDTNIDYNLTKISNLRILQKGFEQLAMDQDKIKDNKELKQLDKIEQLCNLYVSFFINVFGQENTTLIFGNDVDDFQKVFKAITDVTEELNNVQKDMGNMSKYTKRLK